MIYGKFYAFDFQVASIDLDGSPINFDSSQTQCPGTNFMTSTDFTADLAEIKIYSTVSSAIAS